MGSALQRIAAVKAAHPKHRGAHPLRVRLSDVEGIELARELIATPTLATLRDVGLDSNGSAKPTLEQAAEDLEKQLAVKEPEGTTHAERVAHLEKTTRVRNCLWEHLEGLVIDDVEVIEER